MDNKLIYVLLGLATLIIYIINSNIKEQLSERQYVLNTYLYILLAIIIIALSWSLLDKHPIDISNVGSFVGLIILTFISLFAIFFIPKSNQILKNLVWTFFISLIGVMSYQAYQFGLENNTLYTTLIELLVIVGILSFIAYTQPIEIFNSWGKPLMWILTGLIIVEAIDLLFFNRQNLNNRSKIYSWIAVLLFSGFILYDTELIISNGKTITNMCPTKVQLDCADYPVSSLGVILDIVNMFMNISNLNR